MLSFSALALAVGVRNTARSGLIRLEPALLLREDVVGSAKGAEAVGEELGGDLAYVR